MTTTAWTCSTYRHALVGRVTHRAATIRLGDPLAEGTEPAPMASKRRLATVLGFVDSARAEGACVVAGDRQPPPGGLVVGPTVITKVRDPFALG